jgi:putative SOS response-associated peptidase YedK
VVEEDSKRDASFKRKRCIIPVSGYYEWMPTPEWAAMSNYIRTFARIRHRSPS